MSRRATSFHLASRKRAGRTDKFYKTSHKLALILRAAASHNGKFKYNKCLILTRLLQH